MKTRFKGRMWRHPGNQALVLLRAGAAPAAGGSAARRGLGERLAGRVRGRHLPRRLAARARQPQPVHRAPRPGLRDLAPQLRLPRRLRRQGPLAQARAGRELGGLRRRQDLDVQDPPGRQVAGRRAAHRQGRRLHLQLHRRQRPADARHLHRRHHRRRGDRRLHGRDHHRASPSPTCSPWWSPSSPSTSGARSAATRPPRATRTSRRSSAPARSRWSSGSKGKYIRLEANKDYWGGAPKIDDAPLRELQERRHDDRRPQAGHHRRGRRAAAGAVPVGGEHRGRDRAQGHPLALQRARLQLLRLARTRWATPCCSTRSSAQALNWAIDRQKIVDVAFFGQADVGSTLIVPYSPYHWEPAADQAYTYDPEEAKTQLDLAGYEDADGDGFRETKDGKPLSLRLLRHQRLAGEPDGGQAHRRLVRGRRARHRLSRSSTPACCSTPSTTTRATRTRPTTTCSSGSGPTTSTPR